MTQQAAVLHLYDYQTSCIAASYQDKNHCVFHHWHTMLHKDPLCTDESPNDFGKNH